VLAARTRYPRQLAFFLTDHHPRHILDERLAAAMRGWWDSLIGSLFPSQQGLRPEKRDRVRDFQFDLQSALLGEVTPNLRGVTFLFNSEHSRIRFIFDGSVSAEDEIRVDVVDARVSTYTYESEGGWAGTWATETLRLDYPEDVTPFELDAWAYRRHEEINGLNQPASPQLLPLPEGWELVTDAGVAFALMRELGQETGNEQHILHDHFQAFAIARSASSDDVLFTFSDGRVGVVHLTWSGRAETDPTWPFARMFESIAEFRSATATEPPADGH
jgi:hypothetical protein